MAYPFKEVVIIYNPKSTGSSRKDARQLYVKLSDSVQKSTVITLKKTTHRGHFKEIAASYAAKEKEVLLIAASGDGGYNELVNGVVESPHSSVTVAVLPSGNANDHYHATSERSLVERISDGKTVKYDVIEIASKSGGKDLHRYAHSYIGLGLTAYIGQKLTAADLNPLNEKWLVLKYLIKFSHITVRLEGSARWRRYRSIVFANTSRMSKVIKFADSTRFSDGKVELYTIKGTGILTILRELCIGSTLGATSNQSAGRYTLEMKRATDVQCDGETLKLDAGGALINVHKEAIRTLAA